MGGLEMHMNGKAAIGEANACQGYWAVPNLCVICCRLPASPPPPTFENTLTYTHAHTHTRSHCIDVPSPPPLQQLPQRRAPTCPPAARGRYGSLDAERFKGKWIISSWAAAERPTTRHIFTGGKRKYSASASACPHGRMSM
eukprot:scaffold177378_cov20-Tisochrysis_lutea.AAC.2